MKKFKLLPSVLTLVMCVGVLAVGIYAISPAQNNVTGTITVIASNVEVEITAYSSTNKSTSTKISNTVTARTSTPVPIYDGKLEFDGSSASSSDNVADITLVLEIKNNSASKALGVFFLKDATLPQTLTSANITKSINYDGKTADSTQTATNLVTASLPGYTQISAGATVDLVCTLSLNQLTDYDMNVALNLPLVIHEYDDDMNVVAVSLISETSLSGTDVTPTITTSGGGEYKIGDSVTLTATLASEDVYSSHYPVWYAKNSSGEWEEVSTEASYTFTISSSSASEYKVIYHAKSEVLQISVVTEAEVQVGTAPTSYWVEFAEQCKIGDTITIKFLTSGDEANNMRHNRLLYKDADGNWGLVAGSPYDIITFKLTKEYGTEFKALFVFLPNG